MSIETSRAAGWLAGLAGQQNADGRAAGSGGISSTEGFVYLGRSQSYAAVAVGSCLGTIDWVVEVLRLTTTVQRRPRQRTVRMQGVSCQQRRRPHGDAKAIALSDISMSAIMTFSGIHTLNLIMFRYIEA